MTRERLAYLRKKELIYLNGVFLVVLILMYLILYVSGDFSVFFFFAGSVICLQGVGVLLLKGRSFLSLFPEMDELEIYKEKKMGAEWKSHQRMAMVSAAFLIFGSIFMIGQSLFVFSETEIDFFLMGFALLFFPLLISVIVINIGYYFYNRRFDRVTTEKLQGVRLSMGLLPYFFYLDLSPL